MAGRRRTLSPGVRAPHDWRESTRAERHRLQGARLLQPAIPEAQQAEACFQPARTVVRSPQATSWELRAAMGLARLWQQPGQQAEARALLVPVSGWLTEGFATMDRQEAKALLDERRGAPRP